MSLMEKRYRRLVKELEFANSEYEYVLDTLKDAHVEFEIFYQKFCSEYSIPIEKLNSENKDMLNKVYPKKTQEVDEDGLVKCNKGNTDDTPVDKSLQKMYRTAAVKIHPDKFSNVEQTPEVLAKIEMFKEITSSYNDKKWGKFLDICDKLDILPTRYTKVMEIIRQEILKLNNLTYEQKKSFSWRLFECEEDKKCKDSLMKDFLLQLFGYDVEATIIRI